MPGAVKRLAIMDYDRGWPARFTQAATELRAKLGHDALRIDHIGSTSVPELAAKDVIDVQITVRNLTIADAWPDELLPELVRRSVDADHVPAGGSMERGDWEKRYWSRASDLHVHVREQGRANQRYALLFRDYLRAEPRAASAYAAVERAFVTAAPGDWDAYYAVKDPACDLITTGAERWATASAWSPGPTDA